MLVLKRDPDQTIVLEVEGVALATITQLERGRIGIDAPDGVVIKRGELVEGWSDDRKPREVDRSTHPDTSECSRVESAGDGATSRVA